MSYKRTVIKGISWVAVGGISQQIIRFIVTVILARLLTPEAFGLVGMVTVFIGIAQLFSELGLGAAIIQRKVIEERHLSSVFWVNLMAGGGITLLFTLSAPLIANFYQEPILIPLTIAIAFNFSIGALNDVQTALLQREMQFRRFTFIEIGSILISGGLAGTMAVNGFGVWSLVVQLLAKTFAEVILMWITTSWKPKWYFDWSAVRELLGFSTNLLGANIINYILRNVDNLLIGRYVDAFSLGLYRQAYSLMTLPNMMITRLLSTVLLSALAQIQDERGQIKIIVLRAHRLIAFVTMPIMVGLFVVADPLLPLVFGEQWSPMVPILRILCLAGIKEPLDATMGWIYQSLGRTDLQFHWAIFNGTITLIAFFIGVQYGVIGVAIAYALRSYLVWYIGVRIPGRLINLSFLQYLKNVLGIFVCAVLMCVCVWAVASLIPNSWNVLFLLTVQILAGAFTYISLIVIFRLNVLDDLRDLAEQFPFIARFAKIIPPRSV